MHVRYQGLLGGSLPAAAYQTVHLHIRHEVEHGIVHGAASLALLSWQEGSQSKMHTEACRQRMHGTVTYMFVPSQIYGRV